VAPKAASEALQKWVRSLNIIGATTVFPIRKSSFRFSVVSAPIRIGYSSLCSPIFFKLRFAQFSASDNVGTGNRTVLNVAFTTNICIKPIVGLLRLIASIGAYLKCKPYTRKWPQKQRRFPKGESNVPRHRAAVINKTTHEH